MWFCLTCRSSGIAASVRLGITDPVAALDLDNAVTLEQLHYDRKRKTDEMEAQAKLIAYEVSKMFGGSNEDEVTEEW